MSKRPGNFRKYAPVRWINDDKSPDNVMFGTSPVNQKTADTLIPQLLRMPGKRFLSIEPMLGPVDLLKRYDGQSYALDGIDWVIVGGESGHGKRPFNSNWAREVMGACKIMGVPFFMKQIDKIQPIPDDLLVREFPNCSVKPV